ncbi:hypothetical protein [Lactococcus garvieae]|uniref:hypothetical protein n=1 Tax=Lactococcus garvieae TaxID=1363 RepID=UPI0009BD6BA4|nr:hypothetical protein [Lactococcus garvieae]
MNKLIDLAPWIIIPLLIILMIFSSKYKTLLNSVKSDRLNLIKKEYPDLTDKDIKYLKDAFETYKKWYFYTPLQRNLNIILGSALLFSLVGYVHYMIWFKSVYILLVFLTLFLFVTLLVGITPPTLRQHQKFLKKYLKENPENEFKVVLFKDTYVDKVEKSSRIYKTLFTFIVILFLLLTLSFWHNNI